MIIMLNGAFGVGKSTVAARLQAALPNSMIYDPEVVGYMLRHLLQGLPMNEAEKYDFQNIDMWRTLVVSVGNELVKRYQRHLIVPMTLVNPDYFHHIRAGLTQMDGELYHFALVASVTTIHQRLSQRGDTAGSWSFAQTERCVSALQGDEFREQIDTEAYEPDQIVTIILQRVGIKVAR
jgi:chloramphenicol 3-O-phosphotransferase